MNAPRSVAGSLASIFGFALVLAVTVTVAESSDAAGPDAAALQTTEAEAGPAEGRGHFKKMGLNPYMLIPQLIALGFAPIVLANLKMMVMSALMINNMALNAAIFMTVRNMVFGPRPKVKYVNHGYHDHLQDHHHHHHNHRQEYGGDHPHHHDHHDHHDDGDGGHGQPAIQSEQQPLQQHHATSRGTQTVTADSRRRRTDTAIAADSLRRRPTPPPPLTQHRV